MGYGKYREELDCCGSCAKYILFIFNLLVVIGGLAVAILGIVVVAKDDYYRFDDFQDNNLFRSAAFMQIVVGFLVALFAGLGCCGAIRESKCMLFTYGVLTLLVFIVLVVAGVLALVYKNDAKELISKELKTTMTNYQGEAQAQRAWDALQRNGKCCGINGPTDWRTNTNLPTLFPESCCANGPENCNKNNLNDAYPKGCIVLIDEILDFSTTLGWVAIGIGIILLLGVIFAFCVGCSL